MMPEELYRIEYSFFGLAKFEFLLEDRRPDLKTKEECFDLGYKYKTSINIRILKKQWNVIIRSLDIPYMRVEGE